MQGVIIGVIAVGVLYVMFKGLRWLYKMANVHAEGAAQEIQDHIDDTKDYFK